MDRRHGRRAGRGTIRRRRTIRRDLVVESVRPSTRLAIISDWLGENPDSTYEKLRAMVKGEIENWIYDRPAGSHGVRAEGNDDDLPPGTIQACDGEGG